MAKGKVSKKEKERKKREDEERKQREISSQREESGKSREQQAQEDADSDTRRIELEKIQAQQREATKSLLDTTKCMIDSIRQKRWENEIWDIYMSCSGKPDLEKPKEINGFISRWVEVSKTLPAEIVEECDEAFQLLEKLENLATEARHLPEKILKACNQAHNDLIDAIQFKLDEATHKVLQETSFQTNPETGNSLYLGQNRSLKLAIWSNLACNPRYNGLDVPHIDVNFSIPRSIVSNECAIRLMRLTYDHNSYLCPTFTPLETAIFSEQITLPEVKPKKVFTASKSWDEGAVDIRDYFLLGPLLSLNLVAIPSQPIKIKRWIMTKVDDQQTLQYIQWVAEYTPPSEDIADDSRKDEEEAEKEEMKALEELKKLVRIIWKLPENLLWFDIPKLVRWDARNRVWTSTGFYQVVYKEDSTTISFHSAYFGVYALMLPRSPSFPYQSWDLTPQGKGKAEFSITTMIGSVKILVNGLYCCLTQLQSNEKLYLESYYDQYFSPKDLLKLIQSAGLFTTPSKQEHLFNGNIKPKNINFEADVYRQMALASGAMGFSYSRWNASVGPEKFVVRVQDPSQLQGAGAGQATQTVVLISELQATLLHTTEVSQNFSEIPADRNPGSADIYHLVETIGDDAIKNALQEPQFEYTDTIYQLMDATRILCC